MTCKTKKPELINIPQEFDEIKGRLDYITELFEDHIKVGTQLKRQNAEELTRMKSGTLINIPRELEGSRMRQDFIISAIEHVIRLLTGGEKARAVSPPAEESYEESQSYEVLDALDKRLTLMASRVGNLEDIMNDETDVRNPAVNKRIDMLVERVKELEGFQGRPDRHIGGPRMGHEGSRGSERPGPGLSMSGPTSPNPG